MAVASGSADRSLLFARSLTSRTAIPLELVEAASEKPPFRLLPRELERSTVRSSGFPHPAKLPEQIGPRGMSQVILEQHSSREDRIDQGESRFGTVPHRDRDRSVELDDRRRLRSKKHFIQPDDFGPVGCHG